MKIALITSYYEEKYGGNEYYLAKFLSKKGHKVNIYVTKFTILRYGKIKKTNEPSKLKNVDIIRLPSVGIRKKGMNYLIGLKKQLKKDKIDVVHVQEWIMPLTWVCLSFKNLILTQRINKYPNSIKLFVMLFGKNIMKKAKKITALTTESKDNLVKYSGIKKEAVTVIPNGIDTELFKPSKPTFKKDKFTILFVGRLSKEKGIKHLIKACSRYPFDYKLLIVGSGPEKKDIASLVKRLKIQDKVEIKDFIDHNKMPGVYSSADVLIVPSTKEPFGFVTLEALSCGVPVIASNIGGMRDIINDDIGMKVKPKNKIDLVNALIKIKDDKFRKGLTRNCRKYVLENYDWKKIAEKYLKIYKLS
ncbi:MAG: glycosyltransferase family 4 protein [Nanoarchaeota archaeon]|nr:glycosyltransferase family 4 protein [Nanoarchaeota archaeon]